MIDADEQVLLLARQRNSPPELRKCERRRRELEACARFFEGYANNYGVSALPAYKGGVIR